MDDRRRKRILRITLLALLGVGVLLLMAELDAIFAPLLFALLLAYILNPVVNLIQRMKLARGPAIAVLFLLLYGMLIGFLVLTVPTFITQLGSFYDACVGDKANPAAEEGVEIIPLDKPWGGWVKEFQDLDGDREYDPGYVRQVSSWVTKLKSMVRKEQPEALNRGMEEIRKRLVSVSGDVFNTALATVGDLIYTVFGFLTVFILIPIYLFYFLMGLSSMRDKLFESLPGRYRERIIRILTEIDEAVSAFFRGRLIIMLIKGIITSILLVVLGVPFALMVGIITAVGSIIPIAGFLMGMIPGVAIALLDSGSFGLAAGVAAGFIAIEIFENYFLTPWILKERVHLHPVTLVVSVFVGGELFGFVGMLLAVPMTSVAKILLREFLLPEVNALAAEPPPGILTSEQPVLTDQDIPDD